MKSISGQPHFSSVCLWIIDEAGEAKPNRLQAERGLKPVQGADRATQTL